jgi:hypothetical protein
MGHGLDDYARRSGGRKMKIDFSAGRVRPLDPVQAAKLASQCGIHVRSNIMHVATHWNDYSKEGLDHHIPNAISHVAVGRLSCSFHSHFCMLHCLFSDVSYHSLLLEKL